MENKGLVKNIFCAREQHVTPHKGAVDGNGEFVFSCTSEGCNRFVKFAADTTPEQFKELVALHELHNAGQVSMEEQEKNLEALVASEESETQPEQPAEETSES